MSVFVGAGEAINGYDPFDFSRLITNAVSAGSPSATIFSMQDATTGALWTFQGAGFGNFSGGLPGAGDIASIDLARGPAAFSLTGLSLPAQSLWTLLSAGQFGAATALLFAGADNISGSAYNDRLAGFDGNDQISGGDGHDRIEGGFGNDTLDGGAGNDKFFHLAGGDSGIDVYDGGADADFLYLSRIGGRALTLDVAQMASVTGATLGDGTVIRNMEGVEFSGGGGNDTFIFNAPLLAGSAFFGGGGVDTLIASLSTLTTALLFEAPGQNGPISIEGVTIGVDVERFEIASGAGDDVLIGGGAGDLLTAGAGADFLVGGAGDDTLRGGKDNDYLNGGGLDGSSVGTGNDHLRGGPGDDTLVGGGGVDTLLGEDGNDFFIAGAGDFVDGGAGVDSIAVNFASALGAINIVTAQSGFTIVGADISAVNVEQIVEATTAAGNDSFTIAAPTASGAYSFDAGAGSDRFAADFSTAAYALTIDETGVSDFGAALSVFLSGVETLDIIGGLAGDDITGGVGDDTLHGGDGDDVIHAGVGQDLIFGDAGNDTVVGASIGAVIDGGDGIDQATLDGSGIGTPRVFDLFRFSGPTGAYFSGATFSNFEAFIVIGGSGDDTFNFSGLAGDNMAMGGDGADMLTLNLSRSSEAIDFQFDYLASASATLFIDQVETIRLYAGAGDDTLSADAAIYELSGGDGADLMTGAGRPDSLAGDAGADTIFGGDHNDTLDGGADNDRLDGGAQRDLIFGGAGDDNIDAGTGDDTVDGGGQRDSVFGGSGLDLIDGGNGNDTLTGGTGGDTLLGGAGYDILQGDDGDDVLDGGGLNDVLFGNAGNDLFVFSTGGGVDTFRDFTAGAASEDVIRLVGFGAAFDSFAEVVAAASDDGRHTTIDFGNGDAIVLRNVLVSALDADDFIFG